MAMVIDVSAVMPWCFEDEATPDSQACWLRATGEPVVVPALWPVEVLNVLLVAERRGRLPREEADLFLSVLQRLRVEVDATAYEDQWSAALPLARSSDLSAYDASYLELALRRRLPLATRDRKLVAAAGSAGVEVIPA